MQVKVIQEQSKAAFQAKLATELTIMEQQGGTFVDIDHDIAASGAGTLHSSAILIWKEAEVEPEPEPPA